MVAPMVAAAGISAVGSLLGGVAGGKGAKKQQQAALQAQQQQMQFARENRDYQYNINAPTIDGGNAADGRIQALLGLGGDAAGATQAFQGWRDATGYQNVLQEALRSANSSSFAGGAGQSGAALQRLQQTGAGLADRTFNTYMGHLGGVSANGANARGLVAGVGNNATNQLIGASQNGAQTQIGAIGAGTANTQNLLQNLANAGNFALAYGSSYGKPTGAVNSSAPANFMLAPGWGGIGSGFVSPGPGGRF